MYPCHQAMWLIRPGKVLRKKLQDFTLGHAFLLEALESPFMVGGQVGLGDLAVAVLVCSKTFAKAREFLMLPPPLLIKKAQRLGWLCRLRGVKLDHEMSEFREYMSAYVDTPEPWKKKGQSSNDSCLPLSVRIVWCLMERMSEEEAWNCPMSRAFGYYTANAEHNGQEFMSEKEAVKLEVI
jgi:hypothetical protein